jgi:hypothetical protein
MNIMRLIVCTLMVVAAGTGIVFRANLTAGSHRLAPVFLSADGHEAGAYYCLVMARTAQ